MEPNVRYSSVKMQMARQKSELWQAIILQLQGAIISRQQIFFRCIAFGKKRSIR